MPISRASIHGQWSSRLIFILAATGSAVGLGNIWKFPYIAGQYGGGAFVLIYLLCIALIGIPVMMAEVLLGRRGRQSPINTMQTLAEEVGRSRAWRLVGVMGVTAGFIILSFYSVIGGIAVAYAVKFASGVFVDSDAEQVGGVLDALLHDPLQLLLWHSLFMCMTAVVVARGVRAGLEQAVRYMMPALFLLLVLMLGYSMAEGAFIQGLEFLFMPDFSKLTRAGVLAAMGHAFFTLSLGMGAIMMYGSYLPGRTSIVRVSVIVALADTAVALIAAMVIFPIMIANGVDPGEKEQFGVGLIFNVLPLTFAHMPFGGLFGTLFFVLLVFAAWSSAISLIEPAVAWLVESRRVSRIKAAVLIALTIWALGIVSVLSLNRWAFSFEFAGAQKTTGMFDVLDILANNFMLPLGGLAIALFAGWVMTRQSIRDELGLHEGLWFKIIYALVRFVAPIGIVLVFLSILKLI